MSNKQRLEKEKGDNGDETRWRGNNGSNTYMDYQNLTVHCSNFVNILKIRVDKNPVMKVNKTKQENINEVKNAGLTL